MIDTENLDYIHITRFKCIDSIVVSNTLIEFVEGSQLFDTKKLST